MLRGGSATTRPADTYDERLAATPAQPHGARTALRRSARDRRREAYERIAGDGDGPSMCATCPTSTAATTLRGALGAHRAAQQNSRARSRSAVRIATISRPTLGGRSLAAFGSQGQQRSAVLALKSREYLVLDATRRRRRCCCSTTCSRNSTRRARRRFWRRSTASSRPSSPRPVGAVGFAAARRPTASSAAACEQVAVSCGPCGSRSPSGRPPARADDP